MGDFVRVERGDDRGMSPPTPPGGSIAALRARLLHYCLFGVKKYIFSILIFMPDLACC